MPAVTGEKSMQAQVLPNLAEEEMERKDKVRGGGLVRIKIVLQFEA